MISITLLLLLTAAAACLGLSRIVPTRTLGLLSTVVVALTTILLLLERAQYVVVPVAMSPFVWATLEDLTIVLDPQLDAVGFILAITLLGGGTLALFALALALAPALYGFGHLFAWSLLAVAAALLGLGSEGLLLPFIWASAVIFTHSAIRASGALNRSEAMPRGILFGLLATLLLLLGLLAATLTSAPTARPDILIIVVIIVACLMFAGSAPFHSTLDETVLAPAALGGLLYGLVLPLLGLGTLLQFIGGLREAAPDLALPFSWKAILIGAGLLSLLACAANALRSHHMRRILAWQAGAQGGLVVIALGLEGPLAALAAPALLVNLACTTLVGALATAPFERTIGSDDFTQTQPDMDFRYAGLLWLLAAASAVGIPALWGFWGRFWLLEAVVEQTPWVAPLIGMASILMVCAYISPLAGFWQRGVRRQPRTWQSFFAGVAPFLPVLLLAVLLLPVAGLAPQLVWAEGFARIPGAPASLPVSNDVQLLSVIVALVGIIAMLIVYGRPSRRVLSDEDMAVVVLAPDTLAEHLTPLTAPGHPIKLGQGIWDGLLILGRWVHRGMALFEQRFYLAGVLLALISLIFLIAQG